MKTTREHAVTLRANVKTKTVPDEDIIGALKYPSGCRRGRGGKLIKPWLYAVADPWDSKKTDFSRWFVTGPRDRSAFVEGPFPPEQVERIAATGKLQAVCREDGKPVAYELADKSALLADRQRLGCKIERLEGQLRHLTMPTQRGYRRKIERELAELKEEKDNAEPYQY